MKKNLILTLFCLLMASAFCKPAKLPFSKGVNTFAFFYREDWCINQMPALNIYDEADFECLKSMGVDVVRLACYFGYLMEPKITGVLSETVLKKLDEVCDWAEKNQIYLIIDDHAWGAVEDDEKSIKKIEEHLELLWPVLAKRYANRSEYILYEIMNEPSWAISPSQWQKVQQKIINVIREYDKKHSIIVTGPNCSCIDELTQIKPYKDPNIIYTFHFYEPALFSLQGDGTVDEDFSKASGIPFPYDKSRMPNIESKKGTWFNELWETYPQDGTEKFIEKRIKKISDWAKKNKVNIFCGERGSVVTTDHSDRVAYNKAVTSVLEKYDIPYCVWTMDVGSGFFQGAEHGMIFPDDIDKEIVESYGFSMPSSAAVAKTNVAIKSFPKAPYILYDGIVGKWSEQLSVGNVKTTKLNDGHGECLHINYNSESQSNCYKITPPKLIASEVKKEHASLKLSLSVKFTELNQSFYVHFVDSDDGADHLPWRNTYAVKASKASLGKWQSIEIPLSAAKEIGGTWSDIAQKWYESESKFCWNQFTAIMFDFDNFDHKTGDVYIDDITLKK